MLGDVFSRSPLLSLGSVPEVPEHDCDCAWDDDSEDTDGERGVIVRSVTAGIAQGNASNGAFHLTDEPPPAVKQDGQAVGGESLGGESPGSPVLVLASVSSIDLASTGVNGWELVDSRCEDQ